MSMFNVCKKEIQWGGRTLSIETGKISRQADGAAIVQYGDTIVHCAVCAAKEVPDSSEDFFPLTVNYIEKSYAAGRIPANFFRREGRPAEHETLISRLIDRPIRPLFAEGFLNETQVTCTVLSYDMENDTDIVAMIAASAALTFSGIPFLGPIGGAKIGRIGGKFVLNPTPAQMEKSELNLVVAGTKQGVLMVESEAKQLSEEVMLDAVNFGHKSFQPVIDLIISMAEECAKEPWPVPEIPAEVKIVREKFEKDFGKQIAEAYKIHDKLPRQEKLAEIRAAAVESLGDNEAEVKVAPRVLFSMEYDTVRSSILKTGIRIDGRDTKTVRPIECEVGVLPKAHGSALFTRGETQALVVATLGTDQDEQILDELGGERKEPFILHYNFPPYSVGEVKRLSSPGRREIGHGKLAWRAIHPMLPTEEEFPYTVRVVSEIMESNGSSSMATVCGSSLALMDAGVPMEAPVSGIAMGLITDGDKYAVLSDIMGDEDHLGDMDFKVAGTEKGITSLQMDIKITSITPEIMEVALKQAHEGRKHILGKMAMAITASRGSISDNAPRITTIQIAKDKIRDIIGTGGKVIREITEKTGCKIDISDDGIVKIASVASEASEAALNWIQSIVAEPEEGKIYDGTVVKIMDFGAFVNFLGSNDGLVHISEIAKERVGKVKDCLKEGDRVKVKCLGMDKRGKIKLSMKRVDQETGEDLDVGNNEPEEENSEKE